MKKPNLQQELATANKAVEAAKAKAEAIQNKINKEAEKNKPKSLFDTITTLPQVYKHLKVDPKKDIIKIAGFDKEDHEVLQNIVSRMRVAKVYNNGVVPQRGDERWYPWSRLASGAGLVFHTSFFVDDFACTGSAARLAFLSEEGSTKYFKNFKQVEEKIIGL